MQRKKLNGQPQRRFESLEQRYLLTSNIVITEIHYDPPDKTEFSEFIELYNNSEVAVDLSGWQLTEAIRYQFPDGTNLGAGEYLVVSQDPATLQSVFGASSIGPWDGKLKNSGERIRLRDAAGELVDEHSLGRLVAFVQLRLQLVMRLRLGFGQRIQIGKAEGLPCVLPEPGLVQLVAFVLRLA